ncbi:MAG: ABC transporter ATP-binding protein, partial [Bacteroidia bacterium]|nr:ABC transporter ATP-binding protein [Bacteroidia bacterium]
MRVSGLIFLILFISFQGFSQEDAFVPSGKAFATIYANFHQGISGTATDEAAFELVRGYIGYEYTFSPEFYAKINVDVGSPDDLSAYAKARRYAYFKNAYLQYSHNRVTVEFGLISLKQFKLQEDIWERRYLMKTLADEYQLGSSADLGINLNYSFSPAVSADLTIMNGEGYHNIQTNDIFKYSAGTTVRLNKNWVSKLFYDFTYDNINESTLLFFTSYDYREKWNLAGEAAYRKNYGWKAGHNIFGLSVYGKYNITSQYQEGFASFDRFMEIMEIEPDIQNSPDAIELPRVAGNIEFQ